ncbi:hypothetical protein EG827_02045 [bacterium]|nr:hypothetical protein [bacterium]
MKSFRKITAGLFGFDRRERMGTYLLSVMLIILLMVRFTAFRPSLPDDPAALPAVSESLSANNEDANPAPVLFTFDPNTVSYSDLLRLGLTERQAGTLINYRGSGARFRRPEDLARVYGIDSRAAARLGPYIIINETEREKTRPAAPSSEGEEVEGTGRNSPVPGGDTGAVAAAVFPVDLNRCSAYELESLPGIGPVLSVRIIRYRDLLGGFVGTEQLREVYGLDSAVVSLIASMVTLTYDSVAPLILDSVSFGDLARHPYVGYETARVITRYRTLSEAPLTLGSMVSRKVLSPQQAERMAPYVRPSPGAAGNDYEFISSKVLK